MIATTFSRLISSPKTVADVMRSFSNTLAELNAVEDHNLAEAGRQMKLSHEAALASSNAQLEADTARNVAKKLAALVN